MRKKIWAAQTAVVKTRSIAAKSVCCYINLNDCSVLLLRLESGSNDSLRDCCLLIEALVGPL